MPGKKQNLDQLTALSVRGYRGPMAYHLPVGAEALECRIHESISRHYVGAAHHYWARARQRIFRGGGICLGEGARQPVATVG